MPITSSDIDEPAWFYRDTVDLQLGPNLMTKLPLGTREMNYE